MNRLDIQVDTSRANHPDVRLLIDGEDVLASSGADKGNDPADILDTGALLPTDPPRRIAFYGCDCGEFGCFNAAGLIRRRGDTIEWSDFVSVTGAYHGALPGPDHGIDPTQPEDPDFRPRRLQLPTFTFDAQQYLQVVRDAMADRTWESRTRAVIRHLRALGYDGTLWADREGDRVTAGRQVDGRWSGADLVVPPGPAAQVAERLIALLHRGFDLATIAADRRWV